MVASCGRLNHSKRKRSRLQNSLEGDERANDKTDVLTPSLGCYSGQDDEYNDELELVQGVGHGTFSWKFPVIVEKRICGNDS